jgi:hypothetical protein
MEYDVLIFNIGKRQRGSFHDLEENYQYILIYQYFQHLGRIKVINK